MAISPQVALEQATQPEKPLLEQCQESIDRHLVIRTRTTKILGCEWGVPKALVQDRDELSKLFKIYEEAGWQVALLQDSTGPYLDIKGPGFEFQSQKNMP